jgi:hypothetical protein
MTTGTNGSDQGAGAITVADVEQMRLALIEHLEEHGGQESDARLTELRGSVAQLAPDGELRSGGWVLEAGSGAPRLTRARAVGPDLYLDVAQFARSPDGRWRVAELTFEHEWYDRDEGVDQ